jgi:hypothetical protein
VHDRDVFIEAVEQAVLASDTAAAGITPCGVEAVLRELRAERERQFHAFEVLAAEWLPARLQASLLVGDAGRAESDGDQ